MFKLPQWHRNTDSRSSCCSIWHKCGSSVAAICSCCIFIIEWRLLLHCSINISIVSNWHFVLAFVGVFNNIDIGCRSYVFCYEFCWPSQTLLCTFHIIYLSFCLWEQTGIAVMLMIRDDYTHRWCQIDTMTFHVRFSRW